MCKKCVKLWTKELVQIEQKVREFQVLFEKWNTERDDVIDFLTTKASKFDATDRDFNIVKISGACGGFVGGALMVTGIVLTPFTLGASSVLTFTGLGLGLTAGATTVGGAFAELGIKSSQKKQIMEMLGSHQTKTHKLSELIDDLCQSQKALAELSNMKCAQFKWADLASLVNGLGTAGLVTRNIATFVTASIRFSKEGINIILTSGGDMFLATVPVAKTAVRVLTSVTGQSVIVGIGMVVNLFTIGYVARQIHLGSKSPIATELRSTAEILNEERDDISNKFAFILNPNNTGACW